VAGASDSILKNEKVVSLIMVRDSTFIGTRVVIYCLEKLGSVVTSCLKPAQGGMCCQVMVKVQ
jgi:hypothetical protein